MIVKREPEIENVEKWKNIILATKSCVVIIQSSDIKVEKSCYYLKFQRCHLTNLIILCP